MRLILLQGGKDISADLEAIYQFVNLIAKGKSNFESILDWIRNHSENIKTACNKV
jgi:prophage maintenance system killer protein